MNLFFEICHYAIGSLLIGILATIVGVVLLFVVIKGFYRSATFTPLSIITGLVLTILLGYQFVTMSGAIGLKWMCSDFQAYIDNLIPAAAKLVPLPVSEEYASELIDKSLNEFPLIGYFVDQGYFSGFDTTNIASAMADELNSYLNKFIWKSIGWSLLFIAIASFIVIKTMDIRRSASRTRSARTGVQRQSRTAARASASRGRSGRTISGF